MKIAIVTFTYSKDAELVQLQNKALARLKELYAGEHEIRRVIVDDGNSPIPEAERPEADLYKLTTYPRGGNLKGMANLEGMLSTYAEIAEETGAEVLIKLDSDGALNHLGWLPKAELLGKVGQVGAVGRGGFVNGTCNAITPAGVKAALSALAKPGIKERLAKGAMHEDVSITPLIQMGGMPTVALRGRLDKPLEGDGNAMCWFFGELPEDLTPLYRRASASFKMATWEGQTAEEVAEYHASALRRMAEYVERYLTADASTLKGEKKEEKTEETAGVVAENATTAETDWTDSPEATPTADALKGNLLATEAQEASDE